MATSPPIFTPTEDQIPTVLAELINPQLTLCDVAVRHKTGVQALALWMQRPDIAERLNALSAATAFRARALALDQLPAAVGLLRQIMEEYATLIRAPLREAPSLKAAQHRRAATDGARRAVNLLSRLARLLPPTITPTQPAPPLSRAGDDRLERSGGSEEQVRTRATFATHASPPTSASDAEAEALRSLGSASGDTPPEPTRAPQGTFSENQNRAERTDKQVGRRAADAAPPTPIPLARRGFRRSPTPANLTVRTFRLSELLTPPTPARPP